MTFPIPLAEAGPSQGHPPRSLAIARWCAGNAWPVHPLAPGRKTPARNCAACQKPAHQANGCPCLTQGRWCHGFHAATLDDELITRWWKAHPALGVGVACGAGRLVVIDIDAHPVPLPPRNRLLPGIPIHDQVDLTGLATGFDSLALLAALRGADSPAEDVATLRVHTPSGGLHVWYQADPAHTFLCSTGSSAGRALAWQVDIRAHGGYIIAPGTRTQDGVYRVVGDCRVPAPLPSWLAQELARTGHTPSPHSIPAPGARPLVPPRGHQAVVQAGGDPPAMRILRPLLANVEACAATPEGAAFSAKLNRAAYTAGGLVAGGYLARGEAEQHLTSAADYARPGQEVRSARTIASGLARGATRPLHPQGCS
ncbi:bifunctional DNA primase/polymerase [Nonomuraea sp. KM90]|uniref:bifunctional DNA primase/polymerase n=1 Tax=Nonomuraea sp. KM90 TaxID=3457428 RepID=UPI003FCC9135